MSDKWQKVKENIKRNIKPVFDKDQKFEYSFSFDEGLEVFKGVISKEIGIDNLNDRRDIYQALEDRYFGLNIDNLGTILIVLAMKLESFLKRVYIIAGTPVPDGELASCLKKLFRDKNLLSKTDIDEFFKTDDKKKPITSPNYFKDKMPFGEHIKIAYDIRNMESHLDPELDDELLLSNIKSLVTVYLYITFLYYNSICKKVLDNNNAESFNSKWNEFSSFCNNFDKNYLYFLITGQNLNISKEYLQHFSNINWSFVFDFDTNSEEDGLLSAVKENLEKVKVINKIIRESEAVQASFPANTTFWFFSNGINGINDSLLKNDSIFEWKEKYSDYTRQLVREYYKSISRKPVTVVVLYDNKRHVEEVIHSIKTTFDGPINFVFATENNSLVNDLIQDEEIHGKSADISFKQLSEGFRLLSGKVFSSNFDDKIYLPCFFSIGKSKEIPSKDVQMIRQFFDIVHLNIVNEKNESDGAKDFYQGRVITWRELDEDYDVTREITDDIEDCLREWLANRSTGGIVYLYHEPGSGGTTISRRLAMTFYKKYPTLLLNSYDRVKTVEELHRVFSLTSQPLFVIIDNSNIKENQIKELSILCEDRLIKTVFLVVQRTFEKQNNTDNVFFLGLTLHPKEEHRFIGKFSEKFPDKRDIFNIIYANGNPKELTPFYIGLTAYEEKYISISDYVALRLSNTTEGQKLVLQFIAFVSYYAKGKHREIPSFIFSKLLKLPESYVILQHHMENKKILDLIIETDDLHWRALHFLIAEEILAQTLGTNEKEEFNPTSLEKLSLLFIDTLRNSTKSNNTEILDLLRSVFIARGKWREEDNSVDEIDEDFSTPTFNSRVFSKIIADAGYNNIRIEILEGLVRNFANEEPHFRAHLARLYSYDKQHDKAIDAINSGISTLESDESRRDYFILYHIKGMCYRAKAYLIKDKFFGNTECPEDKINEYISLFDMAEEQFRETRKVVPNKEHGYIAYVQMVCQTIEFLYSVSGTPKNEGFTGFLTKNSYKWCRDILSKANDLLERLKWINEDAKSSYYIKIQQNKLLKYYDKPDKLISSWYNLLNSKDVDKNSVRRQVVNAYLAKDKFDWNYLSEKSLNSMEKLLSKNLKNKPDERDIKLWFDVARRLEINYEQIIRVLQQGEFFKETLESAFYLYTLYAIKAINGAASAVDYYSEYKDKCKQRVYLPKSKIFCPEWVGIDPKGYKLIKHKDAGIWQKERAFFANDVIDCLARLSGRVKKYINRNQGFIEIEDCGIEVFYVPGSSNHYSSNKGDKVEFYLGFNYEGPRAFKVSNV